MKNNKSILYYLCKETFWGTFNALFMITAGVAIASFFIYKWKTPSVIELARPRFPQTSIIYDRTGKQVLYEIHGEENRRILSHDQIPDTIRVATIAAEDKLFYQHFGINPLAIVRAFKTNIEKKGVFQGGSTITQQLARNVFLTRKKTLGRKFMEAIIAIKIERNFSKDEILDLYLNEVPYGSNAYGIQSAAQTFFKKDAAKLDMAEATFLAALPKAPTYYSPYGNHKERLLDRYEKIFKKIEEAQAISAEDIEKAREENILEKIAPFSQPIKAPHFVFYVIEGLEKKYGRELLEKGGLEIITTLDMNLQSVAENSVYQGAVQNRALGAENAALVAIDPKNGEILAMAGSRNYFDTEIDGQVNVAVRPRQPGSSFKPVVYSTAFERGYQPETLIADTPTNFGPDGSGGNYIPRNYDGKFHGVLPMRKTLAMSLNVPAIKTLKMVGINNAIDMAHRLGITTLNDRERYGLSLAIGGAEVKPIDLTGAFSVFANDGVKNEVHGVKEIRDNNGDDTVYLAKTEEVISPQVARKINSILSDNEARSAIFGSSSPLYIPGRIVAAKTGTTQEFRDAWTVGYTTFIAVGVWAGNNDSRPMKSGSDGVFVAAPIWRNFMDQVLGRYPNEAFIGYDRAMTNAAVALDGETKDQVGRKKVEEKKPDKKRKKDI
jgi:1A family penicillin-binding protein